MKNAYPMHNLVNHYIVELKKERAKNVALAATIAELLAYCEELRAEVKRLKKKGNVK